MRCCTPPLPNNVTGGQAASGRFPLQVEGSATVMNCPQKWVYFNDFEILQFAEKVLRGVIAPGLLQRLSRRELVELLMKHSATPESVSELVSSQAAGPQVR